MLLQASDVDTIASTPSHSCDVVNGLLREQTSAYREGQCAGRTTR